MEDQKKVWNKISKSWYKNRKTISPTVEDFLKNSKGKILDVGCGSGRNFLKVKNQKIYATDFSEEMIKFAKKNAEKKGIKAKCSVMPTDKLEFPDNYFDNIICIAVLHCMPSEKSRQSAIKEMYRVLKPNGQLLISVWGKKSGRLKNKKKDDYVPWSDGVKEKVLRFNHTYNVEELEKELKEVGFKIENLWEERNVNAICQKK